MPKFLTPPVWYDKNGNLNTMLIEGTSSLQGGIAIMGTVAVSGYNGIAIGNGASVSSRDGIAIRGTVDAFCDNGIAIGNGASVSSSDGIARNNGIAIGPGANVSTQNTIQLGDNNNAYALNVGDGTGTINGVRLSASGGVIQLGKPDTAYTLKVGRGAEISGTGSILEIESIKFKRMTVSNNRVTLSSQGVYLCCTTKSGSSGIAICFIGNLDGNATVLESSTSLCAYVAKDPSTSAEVHQIQASSGVAINYCFKIIYT